MVGGYTTPPADPNLTNVTFKNNSVTWDGGGMYNDNSSPTLTQVMISANTALNGSGIHNTNTSNPTLVNVILHGNIATYGGGVLNDNSSPVLTNVTISGNAAHDGGGMYSYNSSSPTLQNSILWGNTATNDGDQIYNDTSTPAINHTLIAGSGGSGSWDNTLGTDEGNNLDSDPLFVSPIDADQAPTTDGDYRLQLCSPMIDVGNNDHITGITTDLDGNPRTVDGDSNTTATVDLGAYERQTARNVGVLAFSKAVSSGNEGHSDATTTIGTIERTGGSDCAVSVRVAVSGGTATEDEDFTDTLPATITFADGDTTKDVDVTIIGDNIQEPDETIILQLSDVLVARLGTRTQTTYTILDDDTPGVTIVESGDSTDVNEEGETPDTYTVKLDTQPAANVDITITPDSQVTVDKTTLTFTTSNWDTPQTVTVAAVNDSSVEGNHTGTIAHTATSTDPDYNGITIDNVVANITDNDTPGVTITQSGGNTAVNEEGETTDTYTVKLDTQPAANVNITITPDSQVTVDKTPLTFTTSNWDTPQTVTVTAVDDSSVEGDHTGTITHSATSTDPDYNGITIDNVVANVTDNDTAGVTIVESEGSTDVNEEGETSDTYTVQLDSQPTHDVTIAITHDSQVTLNTTTLTFTTSTWNTTQTITVTAVDDSSVEGNHTGTLTHTITSTDPDYNGITIDNVVANITDNDTAGVTIVESGDSTDVNEEGETSDTYTVQLDSQPTHDVTIAITHDSQVTLNTTTLTFTTSTWNTTQTITVTAVHDSSVEGDHTGTLTHTATSTDTNYNGITIDNVVANITDNDTAGVTIVESGDSTDVNEEGETSDTYTVQLDSQPTHDVTIAITHDSQVTLNTTTLTFTDSTWNTTQTITVTAVDDSSVEGDHTGTLTHTITSTDSNYNGITIDNVVANITDNDDTAGTVTLSLNTDTMPESGGSITLTATTDAAIPYPLTVTLEMTGTAIMDKDYTLPSTMLVIPSNETTKTLVIQAKDDPIDEPNETLIISTTHIANGFIGSPARVVATITDDDSPPTIAPTFGDMSICEQVGTAPITMTLGQVSGKPITLTVGTIPATADSPFAVPATPHQDYTPINKTLTITAGESQASIPVPITTDNTNEFDEVFWVGLLGADNALIGKDDMAQVTILDPPCDAARVRFSSRQYRGTETAGTVPVTITVSPPLPELAIVRYTARAGGAQPGSDYHLAAGTVTIPAGQPSVVLDVPLVDDIDVEGDESFSLMLTDITQGKAKIGVPAETIITIEDDDVPTAGIIRVETTEVRGGEADGQREVEVVVVREGGDGRTVTVPYDTHDGTAIAGWDYAPITDGVLTFDNDHSTRIIPLTIYDDTEIEGDHDFTLQLGTPTNGAALGTQNKATITIADDDEERATNGVVQFGIDTAIVSEDALTLTLRVKRTGNISNPIAVGVATFDGSAKAPNDYLSVSQTITFTEGQSYADIAIPIVQDEEAEGDETFTVELTSVSEGAVVGRQDRVQVTIQDDAADQESYPAGIVQFVDDTVSVNESAGIVRLPIQRSSIEGSVTVTVTTKRGQGDTGALQGSDYTPTEQVLTFKVGQATQAITIPILDDSNHEPTEYFLVQLTVQEGQAKAGTRNEIPVIILDNDPPDNGSVGFLYPSYQVRENEAQKSVIVEWKPPKDAAVDTVVVTYTTLNDTAYDQVDYIHQEGVFTFTKSYRRHRLSIPILHNKEAMDNKKVIIRLRDTGDNVVPNGQQDVVLTIVDIDNDPNVSEIAFSQEEYAGNETDKEIVVKVQRTGQVSETATVDYSTFDGTAIPRQSGIPGDYTPVSGTLVFSPGLTTQSFSIPIHDDSQTKGEVTWFVLLESTTGAAKIGKPMQATVRIQDDEKAQVIQCIDPQEPNREGDSPAYVSVQRVGTTDGEVTVDYQTIPGSATPNVDYQVVTGTLTFADGQSTAKIDVPILDDRDNEGDETFIVILENVQGEAMLGKQDSTIVTIQDDDVPVLSFSLPEYKVWENVGTAYLTTTLDRKSYAPITTTCQAVMSTITPDLIHANEVTQPLVFPPNTTQATCTFPIQDNASNESTEQQKASSITVLLGDTSHATFGEYKKTILEVWDDDGPSTVNVTAHPSATMVLANGQDTVWITATVRNRRGEVIPDQPVEFLLSPSLQAWQAEPVETDEKGIAHFPVSMRQVYAGNVHVQVGSIMQAVPVKFGLMRLALPTVTNPGLPLPARVQLEANPRIIGLNCAQQTAQITATVWQQQMFTPILSAGEIVTFTTTAGAFGGTKPSNSVNLTTDAQGKVATTWQPNGVTGIVTVTAQVESGRVLGEGKTQLWLPGDPTDLYPTAAETYVENNGFTEILATLTDNQGIPVPCETITFTTDVGEIRPNTRETNQTGQAFTEFHCPDTQIAQTATITMQASRGVTNTLQVHCVKPTELTVVADTTTIPAQTGAQSILTITVKDNQGKGIAQQYLDLEKTFGQLVPTQIQTNQAGQATVRLLPPTDLAIGLATVQVQTGPLSTTQQIAITAVPLATNGRNQTSSNPQYLSLGTAYRIQDTVTGGIADDYYLVKPQQSGYVEFFLRELPEGADYDLKIIKREVQETIGKSQEDDNADESLKVFLQAGKEYTVQVYRETLAASNQEEASYIIGGVAK